MTAIIKERQRFRRRAVTDDEARAELADEPYKLELIADKGSADAGEATTGAGASRSGAGQLTIYDNLRRDDSRGLAGPVPRTARAAHRLHPGVRADPQLGGVLARRPGEPAAAARLRHRLAEPRGAEGVPDPAGARRRSGTTASSAPSWTCSPSPTSWAPGWPSSTPRAA